jgi:hypothetical protein
MDNTIAPQAENEEVVQLSEKKLFYQDRVQAMWILVISLAVLTSLLVILNLILFKKIISPPKLYFQATEEKQIIPEVPLDKPGIETNVLLSWVVEGMNMAHTFNFMNYAQRMEKAHSYFSKEGYQDYTRVLENMGFLKEVVDKKLVMISMPLEVPEVLKEGALGNRYLWKIKMPIQFNYRSMRTQRVAQFELVLLVARVLNTQSPNGVSIYKYELQPRAFQ